MKYFDSNNLISRKGQFDLQGFKPKSQKLPSLNLSKVRSITPEFQSLSISTNEISSRLNKSPEPIPAKPFERIVLPSDANSIQSLLKPVTIESFALSPRANPLASSRQSLINLEQWFFKMTKTENQDQEAVFDLCFQELVKEISLQCINSARIAVILFTSLKKFWQNKVLQAREEEKNKSKEENLMMAEKIKQALEDVQFFKSGMDEYLQKYLKSDDKNVLLSKENHLLKQVLIRLQQEYKIQTLDLSKISSLIIEDLADNSKKVQKRILNSIIPKCFQNTQVQTIESLIIQIESKLVQTSPKIESQAIQVSTETSENSTQTNEPRKKRNLGIFFQLSLKISPKPRIFIKVDRKKDFKATSLKPDGNFLSTGEKSENFHLNFSSNPEKSSSGHLNLSSTGEKPSTVHLKPSDQSHNQVSTLYMHGQSQKPSKPLEFYNSSRRHSQVSSSSYSEDLKPYQKLIKVQETRPFTPQPVIKSSLKRRKVPNLSKKAQEVLEACLRLNAKDLSYEATISVRTLIKTIESMFYSSIPVMKLSRFKGFLEHVYRKLSNKYSLKKMKEKRLRDLISASVREKDLLLSKLFLRTIGAGNLIGMSNYSIHTFKIILQILNFFNTHLFASPFFTSNGKKFVSKGKVLEISRELFEKRLEKSDFLKLLQQVEHHSDDSGMVDVEWVVSYLVFIFDTYEKQVVSGTQKMLQAVMVVPSLYPSKDEFLLAFRTLYPDVEGFLKDKTCQSFFPFLSAKVSGKSLISMSLIEKISLFRGLFKAKHVENFRKQREEIQEIEFDDLAFQVDNTDEKRFGCKQVKDELLNKIWRIRETTDPELSFLVYSKEVARLGSKA